MKITYDIVFWIQSLLPGFSLVPLNYFTDFYVAGVEIGRFFYLHKILEVDEKNNH